MTPETLMRTVAKAFENGDLQPLFDAVDDKIVWNTASVPGGTFRFGGGYSKRIGVTEILSRISAAYIFRRFEPVEIVADGDRLWGLFQVEADYLPTGKDVNIEIAIRWRVQNNKIVEHQGFLDTVSLLMQQGEFPRQQPRTESPRKAPRKSISASDRLSVG
jgi:ketosteroid isomerase-like protein